MPKVSIIMPCLDRPQSTKRAIHSILSQSETSWEAFIIGDNCSNIESLIKNKEYIEQDPNKFIIENLPKRYGGYGYHIRNEYIKRANGDYVVFLDNDDYFLENHLENYLSEIENTDMHFVYYNTWVIHNGERYPRLEENHIGHSELIIRTDFLKTIPKVSSNYGHDWELIQNMINMGARSKKANSRKLTYRVMGIGDIRE
jgi:glycosyltransferase involved in cell wall biosynthesis